MLATRYSGNLDFMDDQNSLLVDYKLVHTGPSVPPYDSTALWAEPSVQHAAELMRRLYDNQDWAREPGAKAPADAQRRLSLAAAGQRFTERLNEIKATGLGLAAASYIDKESLVGNVDVDNMPV